MKHLLIWEGCTLGDSTSEEFIEFLSQELGVHLEYVQEFVTLPSKLDVGGRVDQLFYIEDQDLPIFEEIRGDYGIRYWDEFIEFNSEIVPSEVLCKYNVA